MEAGTITILKLHSPILWNPKQHPNFPRFIKSCSNSQAQQKRGRYRGPKPKRDWVSDWVSNNDDTVRSLPIYVGAASLLAVLFNRTVSGIAPVADASSSQSRADLLTLSLAVTNILTGLVWLSIRPKSITVVNPEGVECRMICSNLDDSVVSELLWSIVIVYDCSCILQIGMAAESPNDGEAVAVDAAKLMQGSLYQGVMRSGAQSYLANLSLYPGRSELPFLPSNTQQVDADEKLKAYFSLNLAVILQPLGDKGIAIIGGDTIRGFTTSDQAWITFIGEKLDATLANYVKNIPLVVQDKV